MSEQQQEEYVPASDLAGGIAAAGRSIEGEAESAFKPPLDALLLLRPFGHKIARVMNEAGFSKEFDAVEVYCVAVTDGGNYEDLGLREVAWKFVIRELDKSTNEAPWVVGTIAKKRAYYYIPPTVDEMKRATAALESFLEDRRQEEEATGIVSDAFGIEDENAGDSEPF